jgi:hypothetical protein
LHNPHVVPSGAAQEQEAKRFVSCSDDQEVTITFHPAKSLLTLTTADFTSSISQPDDFALVRPVIFISPGNSAQLIRVRIQSRQ